MKKLPGVFVNQVNKTFNNNKNVFYSKDDLEERSLKEEVTIKDNKIKPNINQKINSVFSSSFYVYKALVDITLKDGVIRKKIIGRNATHLITMDNELIPIDDILDIKFASD